jgi:ABC-type sulfate/molybdate transport systems ATPase subunit
VRKQTGVTALHVTHSPREARRLADRLLVLDGGVHELPLAARDTGETTRLA